MYLPHCVANGDVTSNAWRAFIGLYILSQCNGAHAQISQKKKKKFPCK